MAYMKLGKSCKKIYNQYQQSGMFIFCRTRKNCIGGCYRFNLNFEIFKRLFFSLCVNEHLVQV